MQKNFAVFGWVSQDAIPNHPADPTAILRMLRDQDNQNNIFQGMFIALDDGAGGFTLTGIINDHCGQAIIVGIIKGKEVGNDGYTALTFSKQYFHREGVIDYELRLLYEPGFNFKGSYKGVADGEGQAYVSLFPIPNSFFNPPA